MGSLEKAAAEANLALAQLLSPSVRPLQPRVGVQSLSWADAAQDAAHPSTSSGEASAVSAVNISVETEWAPKRIVVESVAQIQTEKHASSPSSCTLSRRRRGEASLDMSKGSHLKRRKVVFSDADSEVLHQQPARPCSTERASESKRRRIQPQQPLEEWSGRLRSRTTTEHAAKSPKVNSFPPPPTAVRRRCAQAVRARVDKASCEEPELPDSLASCQRTAVPKGRDREPPRASTSMLYFRRRTLSRTGSSASHSSNTSHASDASRDSSTSASGAVQARSVDGVPRQCPANNCDARGTLTSSPHAQADRDGGALRAVDDRDSLASVRGRKVVKKDVPVGKQPQTRAEVPVPHRYGLRPREKKS